MEVEIRVDRVTCIGSGQCVHVAPGVFDQDEKAISVVVDPLGEPEEKIVQAVTACPVQAISLYVDGTKVAADDLKDWMAGARSQHALVSVLEGLGEDHHDLRTLLDELPPEIDAARADELCTLAREHLRREEEVHSSFSAMVDPALVRAFDDDHGMIEEALDELAAAGADAAARARAVRDLADALDGHIRLEETVLFPVTLSALARRPPREVVTS